jgi:hypothetical protein
LLGQLQALLAGSRGWSRGSGRWQRGGGLLSRDVADRADDQDGNDDEQFEHQGTTRKCSTCATD